jgi:hypothetical protein
MKKLIIALLMVPLFYGCGAMRKSVYTDNWLKAAEKAKSIQVDVDSNNAVDEAFGGTNATTFAGARGNLSLDTDDDVTFKSVTTDRVAEPTLQFKDLNCTDSDVNASIGADASDTGSNTEDVNLTVQVQVNGTPTTVVHVDADANITVGANDLPVRLHGDFDKKTGNVTLTAAECLGQVYFWTGTGTVTLPIISGVSDGASVGIYTVGAIAVHIDPNAADLIVRDGVAQSDGEKISNQSTAGDVAVCYYYDSTGWACSTGSTSGTAWTNGG